MSGVADAVDGATDARTLAVEAHTKVIEEAIGKAVDDLDAALAEPVLRALASLADDPKALARYSTLAAGLAGANKALRRTDLDKSVGAFQRKATTTGTDEAAPTELTDGVVPWEEAVDGDELARIMIATLARHCVLPSGAATALTLWALAAYGINSFRLFPKMLVRSPQKRCGKSTLVEVMEALVPRGLPASNVSAASVFRCIEAWQPTLLIDEADTFIAHDEAMRGILNSGHTQRQARVIRVEGDVEREPRAFSTWAPTLIAMIGDPPDTIADRSVTVTLERKTREDKVARLPRDLFGQCKVLRRKCQRWALDKAEALEASDPDVPLIGSDRAEDNWRTLLAVADVLGGEWPARGRQALRLLEADTGLAEDDLSIELLRDVRELFERPSIGKAMFSAALVEKLNELADRPWPEVSFGKPLTPRKLASLLQPYRIGPKDQRIGERVRKGYAVDQFANAFARYLDPRPRTGDARSPSATALQASGNAAPSDIPSATPETSVADGNPLGASGNAGCSAVADNATGTAGMAEEDAVEVLIAQLRESGRTVASGESGAVVIRPDIGGADELGQAVRERMPEIAAALAEEEVR